jgi:hypothetical protein
MFKCTKQGKSGGIYSGRKGQRHTSNGSHTFFGCSFDDCTYGCGVQKISQPLTGRLKKGKSGRTSCRLQSILNNSPKSCFFGYITEHRVKLDLVFATWTDVQMFLEKPNTHIFAAVAVLDSSYFVRKLPRTESPCPSCLSALAVIFIIPEGCSNSFLRRADSKAHIDPFQSALTRYLLLGAFEWTDSGSKEKRWLPGHDFWSLAFRQTR